MQSISPLARPQSARREPAVRALCCIVFGSALLLAAVAPALGAQAGTAPRRDPWSIGAEYLQLNSGAIGRHAPPSMAMTFGRDVRVAGGFRWHAELGWLRAARPSTTAEGATLGISADFRMPGTWRSTDAAVPPRLTIRPALALLVGTAESQRATALYSWRGLPSTAYAGQTGTAYSVATAREATHGIGASLGLELRLARGIGLTTSVQRWTFSGDVIAPNRGVTLAGLGVVVHPLALVSGIGR